MAKTSKYAVNEICINGKTYVHNPLFRVLGTGSTPSNPEEGTLNVDWYEDTTGNDTGNVYRAGEGVPDVYGLRASVKFDIQYRGRVTDCYIAGECDNLHYGDRTVMYLDIPASTVLDIVYTDSGWKIVSLPDIMCIKYNDLSWLVYNGYLIPGMKYRIIDYIPSIRPQQINSNYYHVDASVTQFDIIVTALSNTELSEDAEACLPEQNAAARNYYKKFNVNLGSWKLKYTIDDNPIKYDWATGYNVINPGNTLYTDGIKYPFGPVNMGKNMGYTTDSLFIYYINNIPKYTFDFSYDSCFTVNAGTGTGDTASKVFTVDGAPITVYKRYQYVIDGELYYGSSDIYNEGQTSQNNILLISESRFNSTAVAFGIYIECPYVFEQDSITSITWDAANRGVVYNMIDDKGNEAPWDFKNIRIGQSTNTANIGHFFEKQSVNGVFRDASIECNTMFNNVIKPRHQYNRGISPWCTKPCHICSNRFRIITQDEIDNSYYQVIHDNIIENSTGVMIATSIGYQKVSGNHIKNSQNLSISGENNQIFNLVNSSISTICGSGNTVLGGATINIGSAASPSSGNTVGYSCSSISIGGSCICNSIGNGCSNITLGSSDNYNSIGNGCSNITLGSSDNYNSIGNGCKYIRLGTSCRHNSYGNGCTYCYVRLGSSASSSIRNYVNTCHWDDGVSYVTLYNTGSSSTTMKNIHVHRGMTFTSNTFVGVPLNTAYEHTVTRALPTSSNSTIVS